MLVPDEGETVTLSAIVVGTAGSVLEVSPERHWVTLALVDGQTIQTNLGNIVLKRTKAEKGRGRSRRSGSSACRRAGSSACRRAGRRANLDRFWLRHLWGLARRDGALPYVAVLAGDGCLGRAVVGWIVGGDSHGLASTVGARPNLGRNGFQLIVHTCKSNPGGLATYGGIELLPPR